MANLSLVADSFSDNTQSFEPSYAYGPGPSYGPPVLMDSGNGEGCTAYWGASNTRATISFGGALYKLLQRDNATAGQVRTLVVKSTDSGATWAQLDLSNSPQVFGTGYFDQSGSQIICAVNVAGAMHLQNFDLISETWGAVYGTSGSPVVANSGGSGTDILTIWKRSNNTLLVLYNSRTGFPAASGFGGASFDLVGLTWSTFDAGAGITGLAGWTAADVFPLDLHSSTMDSNGIVHFFFSTTSISLPTTWDQRCFYQAINLDNSLGAFFDFPGQVAPFPAPPYNRRQLGAFSGGLLGHPVIVSDQIVLPVFVRNDGVADRFPLRLPGIYIGTPVAAPVWSLAPPSDPQFTVDPAALVNDLIAPQEGMYCEFDGTTVYYLYSAQDDDGQNQARLQLCQSSNLANLFDQASWSSVTAFDLQVGPVPPGFQFATQILNAAAVAAPGGPSPTIDCNNPLTGQVGYPYSHAFLAASGTPPYTFSISAGALPPGITLDPSTGIVSGTPTDAGTFTFTVTVTDSAAATASVDCSILIYVSVIITLLGWKLYPEDPCGEMEECPDLPHVKRAV